MKSPHVWAVILPILFVVFSGCGGDQQNLERLPPPEIPFRDDGKLLFFRNGSPIDSIRVEIADTDSARTRGLMQRYGLPPESGMLFIFEEDEVRSFWMANTQMSLDIFFISNNLEIVSITKYTRPLSPEQVLSHRPARYVLETPAGYADSRGIAESDRVAWSREARERDSTESARNSGRL